MYRLLLFSLVLVSLASARVRPGIEVLLSDSISVVEGKRLGLVTNQTGISSKGESSIFLLFEEPRLKLLQLFAPEHGIDGSRGAGDIIQGEEHPGTGLFVSSLYHGKRHVDPTLLTGLDQVLFDIQDVGVRPYTFVSTLAELMIAAREADIEVVVLDRPNPLGGTLIDGLTLDTAFSSFIGPYPVPYVHGMTVGELALLFNEEFGIGCSLRVIPMDGWKRNMDFGETGLPWVPTSPNVPTWETARGLAMTGALGELGTLSEGVGGPGPFFILGAPSLRGNELSQILQEKGCGGVRFVPWSWRACGGKFAKEICHGVRLLVLDADQLRPSKVQMVLTAAMKEAMDGALFDAPANRMAMFDKAMGTDLPRLILQSGGSVDELLEIMDRNVRSFRELRRPYLIYPEGS
jgi:uncharacterized protein YbbC (DUF1343 family)